MQVSWEEKVHYLQKPRALARQCVIINFNSIIVNSIFTKNLIFHVGTKRVGRSVVIGSIN